MRLLGALLDRIVLLLGVFAAACVPSFIVQYRQRVGGRLEQVLADLAPFQAIADRNHGGSIAALAQYHLQSTDPSFHQEGDALEAMLQSAQRLRSMLDGLDTDLLHQSLYLLLHADPGLLRSTWASYRPAFTLDLPSALFALVCGVLVWALFVVLWQGGLRLLRTAARLR
jgi:hypothetical protein